jgi:hypothetical protein
MIEMMAHLKHEINSVSLEAKLIGISFDTFWYQEDIDVLQQYILRIIGKTKLVENILGADRVNIRFVWKNDYNFVLNFDCYSQSCWLESENELSYAGLSPLFDVLKEILGTP